MKNLMGLAEKKRSLIGRDRLLDLEVLEEGDQLGAVLDADLLVYAVDMVLHRAHGDEEGILDLLVALAFQQQQDDFLFTLGNVALAQILLHGRFGPDPRRQAPGTGAVQADE